jgi:AMP-polyphosphate phosphotransferase
MAKKRSDAHRTKVAAAAERGGEGKPPRLRDVDLTAKLDDKDEYKTRLEKVRLGLLALQQRAHDKGERAIFVFEGWDASGKGGVIKRITACLDPRGFRVHAIGAPRPEEQGRHYLYRFFQRLPAPGEWTIFDRSWYGRVLVERVEKLADKKAWKRAYDEINFFERMLTDDGCKLVKIFLNIDKKEQLDRFKAREKDPHKRWKITDEDWRNRRHWKQYEEATDDMFANTSTEHAPWHVIAANYKWYARVRTGEILIDALR